MKVAIVHDWLVGGGAERVVEELHKLFPQAPIYTSYATDEWRKRLDGKVVTGYLQHFGKLRKFVPFLRAVWFSRLNLKDFDLIISSSGAEAKYVKARGGTVHMAYIHAPTHYYWDRYENYLKDPGFPTGFNWLARLGLRLLVGPLRKWDFAAAQRPDALIANSAHTQKKISQYYGRESVVIHPPVDMERFSKVSQKTRRGFVVAGRQTPYKRIDLAVAACTQSNLPLMVIGDGPEHKKLVDMSGSTVNFVSTATDEEVAEYFASAEAFIFPGLDDFGIVAVEAMAAGTPVIAYEAGGALDYVVDGKTGVFFSEQSVESLSKCLQDFRPDMFDEATIKKIAQQFSIEAFVTAIQKAISAETDKN